MASFDPYKPPQTQTPTMATFNPNVFMEETLRKGASIRQADGTIVLDPESLAERNAILRRLMATPGAVNEPFPYVPKLPEGAKVESEDHPRQQKPSDPIPVKTGFYHHKLVRSCSIEKRCNGYITREMFDNAIQWLETYMWFANPPLVHGDLTADNLVVNGSHLFIVDFEPGATLVVDPMEGRRAIAKDIRDFISSVLETNKNSFTPQYKQHIIQTHKRFIDQLMQPNPGMAQGQVPRVPLQVPKLSGGYRKRKRTKRRTKRNAVRRGF